MDNIAAIARENEFLQDMIEYLTDPFMNIFVYDTNKNEWCYQRMDSSGRDFYKSIPVYAMTENEWDMVADNLLDCIDDYEWGDIDKDEITDFIYEEFPEIFEEWADNN